MTLRRIFLLATAALASVAALVAIAAVVSGGFGETEGKIFATLAATFVAGSTLMAGIALLARGVVRPLGIFAVIVAVAGYVLWAEQIWARHESAAYWKLLLVLLSLVLATLIVSTSRLMLTLPQLVRTLFPATAATAGLAATVATLMIVRSNGDGWQVLAVLVILAALGDVLSPILDRYISADERAHERLLATVDGVSILAVRGGAQTVRVGGTEHRLSSDEGVVVRS
jgi:hypothetical protein